MNSNRLSQKLSEFFECSEIESAYTPTIFLNPNLKLRLSLKIEAVPTRPSPKGLEIHYIYYFKDPNV